MIRRASLVALFLALIGLVVVPSSAHAQEETEPWDTDPNSFNSLIEAIENSEAQIRALEQEDVQNVQFVNIEDIRGELDANQEQRLDQTLQDANTEELHRVLSENETITTSMEEAREDVNVMDVIAIDVREDGDIVVFYEPVM